jgi:tRNA-modifying protein YgfZ
MESTKNPPNPGEANGVVEYAALMEGAAMVDLPKSILRLNGKDPVGMLNAVLTNEVPQEDNLGVYALLLNPKGRIQADLRVLKSDGDVLIDTEPEAAAKELLGRYAPFYRVEIEDLSEVEAPWGILGLYGPRAKELLDGLELAEHETTEVKLGGADLLAAGVAVPVPGYDLLGPADALSAARDHLAGRGAVPVGSHAYETARIKAGIPRFGADITPENFPAEAGILERAVSLEKGCYPGQETVARMHYRGHPNKRLYRFELEPTPAEPTAPGDEILQGEKKVIGPTSTVGVVGWISSVAPIPVGGRVLALGYLSRKADPDAPMRAEDATILESKPVMKSP